MPFEPKVRSSDWARAVLAANYDELFEQYRCQHELCAEEKSELQDDIRELEKKLGNHSEACDAGKYDQFLQQFQHQEKICDEVKTQLREEISELKQKLRKQCDDCAEENFKLRDDISELDHKLQEQSDTCDAEKTRLQTELTDLHEELQGANAMIAGLEDDLLNLQRGDKPKTADDNDFESQQLLTAERDNWCCEVERLDAQLACIRDEHEKAMEKSKRHHSSNDPDYHCKCCRRHTTSHGDATSTRVCVSVTDHRHPSAVDMTASTQDMHARLREMQEKYDEKHQE